MTKLHEIIAVLKGIKSRGYTEVTALFKDAQRTEPYNGLSKTYAPRTEGGEARPAERKAVEQNAEVLLARVGGLLAQLMDTQAAQDFGNCVAKADVVLDGRVVVAQAPVTYLLFLEKQASDVRDFVAKMPTLDAAKDWAYDPSSGLFRAGPFETHSKERQKKALVLYHATDKHPAQTQVIEEDVVVGVWHTLLFSGALPAPRRQHLLDRIDQLLVAIKSARARANAQEVASHDVGAALFSWLLAP